jgi:hypothetical protein
MEGKASKEKVQSASTRENKQRKASSPFKSTQRRNSRSVEGRSSKGRVQLASTRENKRRKAITLYKTYLQPKSRKGAIVLVKAKLKKGAHYK